MKNLVQLNEVERDRLFYFHKGEAAYWIGCAETNIKLSKRKDSCDGSPFIGGPLNGKPKTKENWKSRAIIFQEYANSHLKRMELFKK